MKLYLFTILLIFCVVSVVEAVDPQFAIDMLTGKAATSTKPCSGPPGSGCENIIPQMSIARREEIQVQPERQMTPSNPIEYARQQVPRYPANIYRPQTWVPSPVIRVDTRPLEVAMMYGGQTSYWQRVQEIEAMETKHAYEAELAKLSEKEEESLSETPPDKRIILHANVQAVPDPTVSSVIGRSFTLPPWFYEVLGWVIFGITVTGFAFWGMKILLRT